jgi:hypothetical protein
MLPKKSPSDRQFGFTFFLICLFLAFIALRRESSWLWFWGAAALLFACLAAFLPHALAGLNKIWMAASNPLQKIMNSVVLGVFYLTIFSMFAIFVRLLKRDFFDLKFLPEKNSYWKNPTRSSMKEQF